jgi:hypothetical protein
MTFGLASPAVRRTPTDSEVVERSAKKPERRTAASGFLHERIAIIRRRVEVLLDRPRADPADQIELRPRLVVGARRTRAAERLLADDRAGRLVVDVEVPCGVAERGGGFADRAPILRENRARQRVR